MNLENDFKNESELNRDIKTKYEELQKEYGFEKS